VTHTYSFDFLPSFVTPTLQQSPLHLTQEPMVQWIIYFIYLFEHSFELPPTVFGTLLSFIYMLLSLLDKERFKIFPIYFKNQNMICPKCSIFMILEH
jgi:hypothetical protein